MTLVTGTVQDLGYDGMEGTLWARPARFRSDGQVVYAPERKPYTITGGVVSAELAPGPAVLELQVGSHARGTFEVVIPEDDTTLADLLDTVFPWEPAQISLFVAAREAAEQAAADAEAAAGQATTAAQQTGQDRAHVDQVRTELDEAFDESTAGNVLPPRLTEAALNATYGQSLPTVAVAQVVEPWPAGAPMPRLVDSRGRVWGASGSAVSQSTDGDSWTSAFSVPTACGAVQTIHECRDGDALIVAGATGVCRVENPASASPVVVQKFLVNGSARINPFNVAASRNHGLFAVGEYGPGTNSWADSRYVTLSDDDGVTWRRVWDSDVNATPATAPSDSHVHGVTYDEIEGALYVGEGHGAGAGLYRSLAPFTSWSKPEAMQTIPPPTTLVPTVDGLVGGSDSALSGIVGIPRIGPVHERKLSRVVPWRSNDWDGVIGFGLDTAIDADTGTVYTAFAASHAENAPIITGSTATGGRIVWSWPTPTTQSSRITKLCLLPDGRLVASALIDGESWRITLWLRMDRSPSVADDGGVLGGHSGAHTSVALSFGSKVETTNRGALAGRALVAGTGATTGGDESVVVGHKATALYTAGVAVGAKARAAGVSTIAIGRGADSDGTNSVVIGDGTLGRTTGAILIGKVNALRDSDQFPFQNPVVIGHNASVTGNHATVVGTLATSGTSGVAIGRLAKTSGPNAVAIGANADAGTSGSVAIGQLATVTGTQSVGIGGGTTVSESWQVGFGTRSLAMLPVSSTPNRPATGAVLWVEADGSIMVRSSDGAIQKVQTAAPEPTP